MGWESLSQSYKITNRMVMGHLLATIIICSLEDKLT
jgi:hypothetical protein